MTEEERELLTLINRLTAPAWTAVTEPAIVLHTETCVRDMKSAAAALMQLRAENDRLREIAGRNESIT